MIRDDFMYEVMVDGNYIRTDELVLDAPPGLEIDPREILERALPMARAVSFRFGGEVDPDDLVATHSFLRIHHPPIVFERESFAANGAPDPDTCRAFALYSDGAFRSFGRVEAAVGGDIHVLEHDLDAYLEDDSTESSDILRGAPVTFSVLLLEFHNG